MKKRKISQVLAMMIAVLTFFNSFAVSARNQNHKYSELFEAVMNKIEQDYTGETDKQKLFEAAMKGLFGSLDQYSDFFTEEESKRFLSGINKDFEGIGIQFQKENDRFVVVKTIKGGSAGEAGVLAGDVLVEADGVDLTKLQTTDEVASKILGKKGTTVTVKVLRSNKTLTFNLVRRKLHLPTAEQIDWKENGIKLPAGLNASDVLHIAVTSFGEETATEFANILNNQKNKSAKVLVVDLRDNSGGYVNQVLEIANLILPNGKVVSFKGKNEEPEVYYSYLTEAPFQKIIALTNKNSASGSEILAGAIKDSSIGTVIGESTFGKGVAQEIVTLLDGKYYFKLTYKEFFTPNGTPVHKSGIKPNVEVKLPNFIVSDRRYFIGDVNEAVLDIENILVYLGYLKTTPDTKYDGATAKAITRFQKDRKIGVYPVIDFTTQNALNQALREELKQRDRILEKAVEEIGKILLTDKQ